MASLFEKSACEGQLPVILGGVTLSELAPARITSVAPFNAKERAVSAALKALGLGWPKPGKSVVAGDAACLWSGRGQAFLIGPAPEGLEGIAALTDQSDGWARLQLDGKGAEAVLARLCPVDLRPAAFPVGAVLRTGLNHMMIVLTRSEAETFDILVFRSMATTAIHELRQAMAALAARQAIV